MHRVAGYSESWELGRLIDELRERLGREYPPDPLLAKELEEVLAQLVMRNQRLRVLHRLTRKGGTDDHIGAIRSALEQLDAQLIKELPSLLARLSPVH
jgi:hypothetical protein